MNSLLEKVTVVEGMEGLYQLNADGNHLTMVTFPTTNREHGC